MAKTNGLRYFSGFLSLALAVVSAGGCANQAVERIAADSPGGCTGMLPVAALRERGIDVELASLAVDQVAIGNVVLRYEETLKRLLNDDVLGRWVRDEMVCQASRSFKTDEQRLWFITMKEVAERGSAGDLLAWLRENPAPEQTPHTNRHAEGSPIMMVEFGVINGPLVIPSDIRVAEIYAIMRGAVVDVPGETALTVMWCDGRLRANKRARIILQNVGPSCSQVPLE